MESRNTENALSVSQLTQAIKQRLNTDFSDVWVSGEISGIARPASGHIYLTLKDESAQISMIIWRSTAERMRFKLTEGMQILVRGNVDVYPQRGNYQLIAQTVQPIGQGTLQLAFRQLYERLGGEGLFDLCHKKPLPEYPRRVAVVTSPSGAAIHDFLQVVLRRWPLIEILIVPAKVQGPDAAYEVASGVHFCGHRMQPAPDVIVVTRGGGSIEDLWSFNEEIVVRAIHQCPIPVISAVGHEIDVTLSDLVADVRALTPTEAGEKLVPDRQQVKKSLDNLQRRLIAALRTRVETARNRLGLLAVCSSIRKPLDPIRNYSVQLDLLADRIQESLPQRLRAARIKLLHQRSKIEVDAARRLPTIRLRLQAMATNHVLSRPLEPVQQRLAELDALNHRLSRAVGDRIALVRRGLESGSEKLSAFNPTNVLLRGYTITTNSAGNPIVDCQSVHVGDRIHTSLANGKIVSRIEEIQRNMDS
jgi:exodeoxyribonuclease VII large subunit